VELHEVHLPEEPRGKDFTEGPETGIYSVGPLARMNAADGMATPRAQAAREEFFKILGGRPVHHTLANHWARVIEMIYAAERIVELVNDPEIASRRCAGFRPRSRPRA